MKRIVLSGCNGKMGRMIASCVKGRDDCTVVAGIDVSGEVLDAFPVFTSPAGCQVEADVIIDFSHPSALAPLLDYAAGHPARPPLSRRAGSPPTRSRSSGETSARVPLFFTANMSLGVNLLVELAKKAAAVLGGQFDIEIIEKHHNQKIDAPSGTALMLAGRDLRRAPGGARSTSTTATRCAASAAKTRSPARGARRHDRSANTR